MNGAAIRLSWLSCCLLAAGLAGVEAGSLLGAAAIALVLLTALRLREAQQLAARRQVALLQLVSAGLLAALQPDLGPSLLQLAATVTALAGLLALELGDGPGAQLLLRRSLVLLAAALPMALLLFLLLPRLGPLIPQAGSRPSTAQTGLSEQLEPGSIARLASDNAPAARVSFDGTPAPSSDERYWRVLVHRAFDGQRWLHRREPPLPTGPEPATGGSQFWIVEANGLAAVPWSGSGLPQGNQLRALGGGELLDRRPTDQRRTYTLLTTDRPAAWRTLAPTPEDRALPAGSNPRLEALGASWQRLGSAPQRLQRAEAWFRSQPFRYSTNPGTLPPQAGLDAFLFERQQGFCGHYASAYTALMRAAGVPARVVSGYLGGTWVQPLGGHGYLDLRQSDAHAWSEVWLEGQGWQRVDPTTWVAPERRQANPRTALQDHPDAVLWLQRQWWGLDLAWSRWWQGFDRQGQEALLQKLLGDQRQWLGPLLGVGLGLGLGGGVLLLRLRFRPRPGDARRRELERVLRALRPLGLEAQPGDTLAALEVQVAQRRPDLAAAFASFITAYRQGRYGPNPSLDLEPLRTSRRRVLRQLRRGQAP